MWYLSAVNSYNHWHCSEICSSPLTRDFYAMIKTFKSQMCSTDWGQGGHAIPFWSCKTDYWKDGHRRWSYIYITCSLSLLNPGSGSASDVKLHLPLVRDLTETVQFPAPVHTSHLSELLESPHIYFWTFWNETFFFIVKIFQ